jgi:hypothetical protein
MWNHNDNCIAVVGILFAVVLTFPGVAEGIGNRTDLDLLGNLTNLHRMQSTFFHSIGGRFNQSSFANGGINNVTTNAYTNIQNIRTREDNAVDLLNSTIHQLNSTYQVVEQCFDFNVTDGKDNVNDFLSTAEKLSSTITSVYPSIIANISNDTVRELLASILVGESQTTGYLNSLLPSSNGNPFTVRSNDTQQVITIDDVQNTIHNYVTNCT